MLKRKLITTKGERRKRHDKVFSWRDIKTGVLAAVRHKVVENPGGLPRGLPAVKLAHSHSSYSCSHTWGEADVMNCA
jgi:hypothetical protein